MAIDLPPASVSRLAAYANGVAPSRDVTEHWQSREATKVGSFTYVNGSRLLYTQQENGLDDYYPANFGHGPLLSVPSRAKRAVLRRLRRVDPLAFDPLLNYEINPHRDGPLALASLDNLDVGNPNWTSVRAVLIANMLAPHVAAVLGQPQTVLEIGPGAGNLLYCFKKLYPQATCIAVDLPSSVPFSAANLLSKKKDAVFLLPNEVGAGIPRGVDFVFLRDDQTDLVADSSVDLMVNTVSFAEMSQGVVRRYFDFLRRVARQPNLFYCLNRVEKLMRVDGREEALRFHEYPWRHDDRDVFFRMSQVETPRTTGAAMFEKLTELAR